MWRRRDDRAEPFGHIGLINCFGKVASIFSEQQPRQKQRRVAFAYPAFGI